MNRLTSTVFGIVIVLACAGVACSRESVATITVEAGAYDRVDTPVSVTLRGVTLSSFHRGLMVVEKTDSGTASCQTQLEAGREPRLWFVLAGTTKAGTTRTFSLVGVDKANMGGVTVVKTDKYLDIVHGGDKVLRYNHAIIPPPDGQDKLYERSGFIHPLWSTKGTVLTNIHPKDHIHHLGIWMPWTHTEFEGKPVDFWNLKEGQGTVRFVRFVSTTQGPVYGGFQAEQEHVALKTDEGRKVVLNEVWDVRVFNVGGPEQGYRIVDFVSTQRCVADSPLKQVKYRYGGFGYRATGEWDEANAEYLTSEGKNRKDGHATRARWCDTSGEIDGWEGITFYSHPQNFEHPEPMRIWPDGQVFFNFCPSQATDWEMKPGVDHVFRYRMYVHQGKITVPAAERIWHDYAEPPKVTIEPAALGAGFSWEDTEGRYLDLLYDGRKVTRYMYAYDTSSDQRTFETYKVLHHVFDENGRKLLTNGPDGENPYPKKGITYPHHRGIFIGWNKLTTGGKSYDTWHMTNGVAQVHQRFLEQKADAKKAVSTALIHWKGGDGKVLIEEKRTVTVHPPMAETVLLLDFETELKAVGGEVFLNGDPEHAGFQYRPHNDVAKGPAEVKAKYLFHKDGIDPKKDKDLPWVAMSYGLNGKRYSVQHISHPSNPEDAVYSAYRDYGRFGEFFKHTIPAGQTLKLRYQIWIGQGDLPDRAELERRYSAYIAD